MIGYLFRNYVNEMIEWEEFVTIVNSIFLRYLDSLKNIYLRKFYFIGIIVGIGALLLF